MLDPELTRGWLDFDQFQARYEKVPVREHSNCVTDAVPDPLLSVVLVTYQHAQYIESAIESVLMQQTTFPFEFIIGDDDSNDGTREICLYYAERFPDRIRLFLHHRENNISVLDRPTGIFQIAFNLLRSRGRYLALTSGDDYWTDKAKLETQVQYLEKHTNVSLTYHDHLRLHHGSDTPEGPFKKERIQSVVGRNIFGKLPKEFLQIMQEDSFMKYFWRSVGETKHLPNISPLVIRIHPASMFTSLHEDLVIQQKLNYFRNLHAIQKNNRKEQKKVKRLLGIRAIKKYIKSKDDINIKKLIKTAKLVIIDNEARYGAFEIIKRKTLKHVDFRKNKNFSG